MKKIFRFVAIVFFMLPGLALAQKIDTNQLLQDLEYLASDELEGRKPLSEGSMKARQLFKDRFESLGMTSQYPNYTQYFELKERRIKGSDELAANIVGFIPGEATDKLLVIMAHYDHLGKQGDKIFNGADDNASGAAAVLAFASYFSENRPNHSMLFVALDAEEMGMQGAKAFVDDFPFPIEQVVLNINMDMISRNEDNEIYAVGTHHYPHLKPTLETIAANQPITLRFGHDTPGKGDWSTASDHAQFHKKGIPFIYFGVEDHADYHKETDIFENIQPEFYKSAVELILDAIIAFDKDLAE